MVKKSGISNNCFYAYFRPEVGHFLHPSPAPFSSIFGHMLHNVLHIFLDTNVGMISMKQTNACLNHLIEYFVLQKPICVAYSGSFSTFCFELHKSREKQYTVRGELESGRGSGLIQRSATG